MHERRPARFDHWSTGSPPGSRVTHSRYVQGRRITQKEEMMSGTDDFGTFGRFVETPVGSMSPEMKEAYEFTRRLRGLVPGPHKIWLANPALSKTIVPTGAYFQRGSTLTKPEIEIATNIVNGRWRSAYANYEHEIIGERDGHLDPRRVEALIAGLPTSFDDPRQQVVYELASTLVAPRVVPLGLYRRARELLGDAGIVDVTVLLGWFTMVCMTLGAFDVPADAEGLDQ
jgi:4-carboxymuconolactone decarboxylase